MASEHPARGQVVYGAGADAELLGDSGGREHHAQKSERGDGTRG